MLAELAIQWNAGAGNFAQGSGVKAYFGASKGQWAIESSQRGLFAATKGVNVARLSKARVGELGEKIAQQFLRENGYKEFFVLQNYSNQGLDLIARSRTGRLVFFEVKATAKGIRAVPRGAQASSNSYVRSALEEAADRTGRFSTFSTYDAQRAQTILDELNRAPSAAGYYGIRVDLLNERLMITPW